MNILADYTEQLQIIIIIIIDFITKREEKIQWKSRFNLKSPKLLKKNLTGNTIQKCLI